MRRPLDWAYAERSASRLPIRRNLGPDRLRWTIHRSRYPPLCSRRCPSNCPIPFFLGKLKLKFRRSGRIGVRRGTATSKRPLFRQVTGRGGAVTAGGGARRDVTCSRRPMSVERPAQARDKVGVTPSISLVFCLFVLFIWRPLWPFFSSECSPLAAAAAFGRWWR